MTDETQKLFRTGGPLRGGLIRKLMHEDGAGPELAAGTVIGAWQVARLLGSGGMSNVYLANRCDGQFEQSVALKVVRRNPALQERLRHERSVIASLHHPHIVGLIDGGETEEGDLWFAMALVEGEPIDLYVQQMHPDSDTRLRIFDSVCAAVAYAHSRTLIHRDIKPANILVDVHGHPRLLDFGIAISAEQSGDADRVLTLAYASPEQRAGSAITVASDIYQLGKVLDSMFPARDGVETLSKPMPVSPAVAGDIAALIRHATAAEATDRYPTVAALREDVQAILTRQVLSIDRHDSVKRLSRFVARHRIAVTTGALAAAVLAVVLITSAFQLKHERDIAIANEARANAVSKFLVDTMSQANPYSDTRGGGSVLEAMDRAASRLDDALDRSVALRRTLRTSIGSVYLSLDEADRCLTMFGTDSASNDLETASLAERAHSALILSECHLALDHRPEARAQIDIAAASLEQFPDPSADSLRSWVLVDRGQLMSLDGELERANVVLDQALGYARSSGNTEQAYRALRFLGGNANATGQSERAIALYTEALAEARKAFGSTNRSTLTTAGQLASAKAANGEFDSALHIVEEAVTAAETLRHRGKTASIVLAQVLDDYGTVLWRAGRLDDCIKQAQTALALYQSAADPDSSQGFNPSWRMAICALQKRDYAAAKAHAAVSLHYARNGVPVGVVNSLRVLAEVATAIGSVDEARQLLDQTHHEISVTEIGNKAVVPAVWLVEARLAHRMGDPDSAKLSLDKATQLMDASGYRPPVLLADWNEVKSLLSIAPPSQ